MRFDENPFICQSEKGQRVSNFVLLLVIFKWHNGSKWVKYVYSQEQQVWIKKKEEEKKSSILPVIWDPPDISLVQSL